MGALLLSMALPATTLQADLLLGGVVRGSGWVDIEVVVSPPAPGQYLVVIAQGDRQTTWDIITQDTQPIRSVIPFFATAEMEIMVNVEGAEVLASTTLMPQSKASGRRRLLASPSAADMALDHLVDLGNVDMLIPAAQQWPQHSASLHSFDLVLWHVDDRAAYSDAQQQALEQYAGRCMPLVVIGPAAGPGAGCQQVNLQTATTWQALTTNQINSRNTAQPLPHAEQLAALLDYNKAPHGHHLAWLLMLYIVACLALFIRRGSSTVARAAVWTAPLLTLLLMFVASRSGTTTHSTVLWQEQVQGDQIGRASELLHVAATRHGQQSVTLPGEIPWQPVRGAPGNLQIDMTRRAASWDGYIGEQRSFVRTLAIPAWDNLAFEVEEEKLRLHNPHPFTSEPGILAWNNQRYNVPALDPGATWTATSASPWQSNSALQLFRQRALRYSAGLLQITPATDANPGQTSVYRITLL
ncbi:MAG: hypothetical protein AAF529_04835 [Pseudomonadota bacterium]